jgi:hypothetical protein
MAYKFITPRLGAQAIADASTTQKHYLGEIAEAVDDTSNGGVGQFIYVQASNSITQFDAVAIKGSHKCAPLTLTNAKLSVEVGFSQSAVGTKDSYIWVQKQGRPIIRAALATQPDVPLFASATGGVLTSVSTSALILGVRAITQVTNSAGQSTCVARYPTLQRRIGSGT